MTSAGPGGYRCAAAAEHRADVRFASAPPAEQWFLIEHPGPWARLALAGSGLAPAVIGELGGWVERTGGRVVLIRRSGRRASAGPRRWCHADARPGSESVRWGTADAEVDLVSALHEPTCGEPSSEPVYLVCAHGRHDACCALRGRPVAAALAAEYPERTWECSHLGGDRFAANLVVLPHGLYYAHVSPAAAAGLARSYDRGVLAPRWLRGRSSLPAPVQAAQHHLRLATGETGVDAYPALAVGHPAPDRWEVRFGAPTGDVTVTVRARMHHVDEPLTCAATGGGRYRVFDLVDLVEHR